MPFRSLTAVDAAGHAAMSQAAWPTRGFGTAITTPALSRGG
ncbi:MAG: hypothetical protein ACE5I7_02970 [Candidatus Binatia bacterium]